MCAYVYVCIMHGKETREEYARHWEIKNKYDSGRSPVFYVRLDAGKRTLVVSAVTLPLTLLHQQNKPTSMNYEKTCALSIFRLPCADHRLRSHSDCECWNAPLLHWFFPSCLSAHLETKNCHERQWRGGRRLAQRGKKWPERSTFHHSCSEIYFPTRDNRH